MAPRDLGIKRKMDFGAKLPDMTGDYTDYIETRVTADELPALASVVVRGFEMFQGSARVLFMAGDRLRPVLRDVFVESFNIHARALDSFFADPIPSQKHRLDDVVALHYADGWDVSGDGHVDLAWLRAALKPANC